MGRIKKKGDEGMAKEYISRSRAVRKLQLSLADFRRLCILKGVYPREPPSRKKVSGGSTANRTYYFTKDINWLLHEPLLQKFRDFKVCLRKAKKAKAKKQDGMLERWNQNRPHLKYDHLVKERYPTFVDAVRDLDDCLCSLFLFANFPQTRIIKGDIVTKCQKLCQEFMLYIIKTRALRKVFLSIKGIYYQAEIQGQPITWIAPYKFSSKVPIDVDFRVMSTFLDFYRTMMGFVNWKLFHELGFTYPPKIDTEKEKQDCGLSALVLQMESEQTASEPKKSKAAQKQQKLSAKRVQSAVDQAKSQKDEEDEDDEEEPEAEDDVEQVDEQLDQFPGQMEGGDETVVGVQAIQEHEQELMKVTKMFDGLFFFLSREVPRESLEFVIQCFGGQVSWESYGEDGAGPYTASDSRISHHIVDRPAISQQFDGRHYIQPQWVYDCINAKQVLPTNDYTPGAVLPPHLSPFVEETEDEYMPPERKAQLAQAKGIHEEDLNAEELEGDEDFEALDDDELYQQELEAELNREDTKRDASEAVDEEDNEPPTKSKKVKRVNKAKVKAQQEAEEATEQQRLAKMMAPRKDRKLHSRMMHGKKKKQQEAAKLTARRQEIDAAKKKTK